MIIDGEKLTEEIKAETGYKSRYFEFFVGYDIVFM